LGRRSVDVVLAAVVDRAGIELSTAIVRDASTRADGKARCWGSTDIALELCGGRCKDTSTSVGVSEAAVAQAVAGFSVPSTDTVLSIRELTEDTGCSSRSLELDTLLCGIAGNEGVGTKAESDLSKSVFHVEVRTIDG